MRRLCVIIVGAFILSTIATFAIWWNYASLQASYPRYKTHARNWWWHRFGDPFDVQVRSIAGFDPKDCSPRSTAKISLSECIADAFSQRRGFRVRANFCGIDSCGVEGVIGNAHGDAYELYFDNLNGYVLLSKRPCPSPLKVSLGETKSGYSIHCEPQSTDEHDFQVVRDDFNDMRKRASK